MALGIFSKFCKGGSVLMLVYRYVAGEGVELTVHKKSVVVDKIKEVELRSRRAQLFMTEIIIDHELGHSHAPSRLPVKKLTRLLHKRRKLRIFVWKGIWKNIISYYSLAFTIYRQPRPRSVRSHSVLFSIKYLKGCYLINTIKGRVCILVLTD